MNKKGFTLIELLVIISIVGLLGSTVISSFTGAISRSQGTYELRLGSAVIQAFQLKALDDNIFEWWHEDEFPESITWGSYIQDIIDDEFLSEFLPIIPDENNYSVGGTGNSIPYAYDNDGDVFTNPSNCFATNSSQNRSFRGVNLVYNLGINQNSAKWVEIVTYLDESIDNSDGPFCGRLRYALFGNAGSRGQIIYAIDFDQTPDF